LHWFGLVTRPPAAGRGEQFGLAALYFEPVLPFFFKFYSLSDTLIPKLIGLAIRAHSASPRGVIEKRDRSFHRDSGPSARTFVAQR
jgi:hypothetical protein